MHNGKNESFAEGMVARRMDRYRYRGVVSDLADKESAVQCRDAKWFTGVRGRCYRGLKLSKEVELVT